MFIRDTRRRYMINFEKKYWQQNKHHIAGIDEVGRGCLLGDVVAAAVILPIDLEIEGINDSKKLSPKKREACFEIIMDKALAVGIGRVDSETIDDINIKQATRLAMEQAVEKLKISPDYLFIDAEKINSPIPQLSIIKGDQLSQSIAAASIVAKVTRDRLCLQWDLQYPQYDIAKHKGYGTKLHREHITNYGPCPLHRRTFLKNIINVQQTLF
ncbi:ribonuclease HII [Chengkuizengella axinellae]|uniref:Ribonuclease HII n=1 Tax=Chengkuizengella axinellae TaxID=3064388 RepID=A0ABT9IX95_9BACL|nr:ribonuclease HII [Chengkuizengella sp. 2205SS18-9]MDP5273420.1 ribonuclease HII [Chengkuizengella sp. 2205SS18-9]